MKADRKERENEIKVDRRRAGRETGKRTNGEGWRRYIVPNNLQGVVFPLGNHLYYTPMAACYQ